MNKVLVIVGPTATGKSALGRMLAKRFDGAVISADARQIYTDFDIGTGKEVGLLRQGQAVKGRGQWTIEDVPVLGYDLIDGHTMFSAYDYAVWARQKIDNLWSQNMLPILVGGTGFYLKATLTGLPEPTPPIDEAGRRYFANKNVKELQALLNQLDDSVLAKMNQSDKHNPRRLQQRIVRAAQTKNTDTIDPELARFLKIECSFLTELPPLQAKVLKIGLLAPNAALTHSIRQRVTAMFDLGLPAEVNHLIQNGYTFKDPALNAIGYQEFSMQKDLGAMKEQIILHTIQYSKRQQTWFKADKTIHWIQIDRPAWREEAATIATEWYNK